MGDNSKQNLIRILLDDTMTICCNNSFVNFLSASESKQLKQSLFKLPTHRCKNGV